MKTLRILPPDVFDALEFSALAFGGIGAGEYTDDCGDPLCAVGHRRFLSPDGELLEVFYSADITIWANDQAVFDINRRHGAPRRARVPFDEWCAEMNVIRGE